MMPEIDLAEDHQAIVAGAFRLVFRRAGDRWTHDLERRVRGEPAFATFARSFEGDPDRDDPEIVVSPAYQQITLQEAGPGTIQALLVGQSGPHHFSAVFEFTREILPRPDDWPHAEEPGRVRIKVDVADRCRSSVRALAATYRLAATSGDLAESSTASGPIGMAWDLGPDRLAFAAAEPARVAFAEDGRRGTRVQAVAALRPAESTHRWTYDWAWEPDARPRTRP